ncbi:Right handed beta helix region [Mucilaginibacter gossypiicola]|uniref:Right handed beta helix region n=1 Tax=Mucilaginibacter gossypiicola TaxID=551995 RepID=A0A1H8NB47_9SPHI|nr:right-handed parallel beta-helix repeat-containing protein [Mucilaginibacter gossypiicola]SEO26921.1 Right handed beta helix region [Mucilaginibacter gossypiicola]
MKTHAFLLKLVAFFLLLLNCGAETIAQAHEHTAPEKNSRTAKQYSVIDVSTDLKKMGIAQQNMLPDNNTIDAGPLLEAAVIYAGKHNYNKVNVPAGTYYFKSVRDNAHAYIFNTNNVVIECNNATFSFSSRKACGIIIRNCNYVGIQNVKLDYGQDLPFTSATVASVDAANNAISVGEVTGRPLSDFTSSSRYSVRIFVLRKTGNNEVKSVPVEWLFAADGPLSNTKIVLKGNGAQLAANLAKVQPGDILCVSERSYAGNNALAFMTYPPDIDSGNYAKNVTVYSSPAIGVSSMWQNNLSFSNLKVMPKPGRVQYISSNADGINVVNSGNGNSVNNCTVLFSGDDGISFSGNLYATVTSVNDVNGMAVNERYKLKANQKITFVDPDDLREIGSATISDLPQRSSDKQKTNIRLSSTVQNLKAGTLIYLPQDKRSNGIAISGNTIRYPYSRGIYFSGVNGAQITGNTIEHTQSCAILGQAGRNIPGVSNTVIKNNVINSAFEKGTTNQPGAIEISVEGKVTSAFVNRGMEIRNNQITIADGGVKHVGIFISNTQGYSLSDNSLKVKVSDAALNDLPDARKVVVRGSASGN